MTKYKVLGSTKKVDLNQNNFKAKGGEGSFFVVGDVGYKICEDGHMIPEGKFKELNALDHPNIIVPKNLILDDSNSPVGYTMNYVPDAVPLAKILSKSFRIQENLKHDKICKLVKQGADCIRFIHSKPGYLQVDGNEYNYMVTNDYESIYLIDVNSYQTPHYPADAIMSSIRDFHCPVDPVSKNYIWSHDTDWYSYAVLSFYMMTAIHPFMGNHKSFPDLKTFMVEQMKACKSVLDSEVTFPKGAVFFPFENYIPGGKDGAYMQWYKAIFVHNKRLPAPLDFQSTLSPIVNVIVQVINQSNYFKIEEIGSFDGNIIGFYPNFSEEVIVTENYIYVRNQKNLKPNGKFKIGFTPLINTPILVWLEQDKVKIKNLFSGKEIDCNLIGKNIMSNNGSILIQNENSIYEMTFFEQKDTILVSFKILTSILPKATDMFKGCAFQNMFGTKMVSLFPSSGHHKILKIEELLKFKIIDAKFQRNVLMVLAYNEKDGSYNRFVFRFSKEYDAYDVRKIENVSNIGVNFTVLDNGVCVCINEKEEVEMFSNIKDESSLKSIKDDSVKIDMHLCSNGSSVKFAKDNRMYSFSVKKS